MPIPELRRTERQESESWEFSPESAGQDEHFEMFMRNHRPSTVHESEEVSRSLREAESDSVLGQIHLELAKYHELGRFSNEGEMDSDSALFHLGKYLHTELIEIICVYFMLMMAIEC